MSDLGRNSIWQADPAVDSWYNAAVADDFKYGDAHNTADMEEKLYFDISKANQVKYPSSAVNDWFYETMLANGEISRGSSESNGDFAGQTSGLKLQNNPMPTTYLNRLTIDKPLPALPSSISSSSSQSSAAGLATNQVENKSNSAVYNDEAAVAQYSPDNLSFEVDDDVSEVSDDFDPVEYDLVPSASSKSMLMRVPRPILQPKSRKHLPERIKLGREASPMVIDLTRDSEQQFETSKQGIKRNASEFFVTKSYFDASSIDDDDVQYLYTKKLRTSQHTTTNDLAQSLPETTYNLIPSIEFDTEVQSLRTPSYSPITDRDEHDNLTPAKDDAESIHTASSSIRAAAAIKGYPGQFEGLKPQVKNDNCFKTPKLATTFGSPLHPNYLFTNFDFHHTNHINYTELSFGTAARGSDVALQLDYAWAMHHQAGKIARTKAEEELRKEIQLECTMARLEGISVGEYRYYMGHLNIEEYNEAKMCICWEECACSKLCTRFGDLLCPCAGDIIVKKPLSELYED